MDRTTLPFRENCEGFFTDDSENVLASLSQHGYPVFPGGGIRSDETPEEGMIREAREETGVVLQRGLVPLGDLFIVWDTLWAKTDKQKQRYQHFQGDHMHFFTGHIAHFIEARGKDAWTGETCMPLSKAISLLERFKPFPPNLKAYHNFQLSTLIRLKKSFSQ